MAFGEFRRSGTKPCSLWPYRGGREALLTGFKSRYFFKDFKFLVCRCELVGLLLLYSCLLLMEAGEVEILSRRLSALVTVQSGNKDRRRRLAA